MRKNFGAKPFLFPQPVMIIGTYDENGKANAMNAAWGGIVGTDEIMIDLSSHKTTDNIMRNKAFTVSVGDVEHMVACDYVGLVSANKEDRKMEKAGFTTTESSFVHAPIINELPLTLECELLEVIGGSKYLGKIVNVSIDERVQGDNGQLSLEKFSPITYDTVHYGYYRLGERVGNAFKDGTALILMRAAKIAVGSSAAIYIAQHLELENAASAGTITLLTLVTTKWETLKLSLFRLITFALSVFLAAVAIGFLESEWIAYGIYIFVLISVCHSLGWQATVSVNSVIGIHFLTSKDFSTAFLLNEFLLVLIGITIAVILNLFYDYSHQKNGLVKSMRDTEKRLQMILGGLAAYLSGKEMQHDIWSEMRQLEQDLMEYIREACEY